MLPSILFWVGWLAFFAAIGFGLRLYRVLKKSRTELAFVHREYRNTLHLQRGMTFKFKKINGQFIHTFCAGELAYRLGPTAEFIVGKTLSQFIPDEDYVRFKEWHYERAWQGENVSYEGTLNGVWYIASLSPVYVDGKVAEVIASCADITEQKLAENRLRESEQRYRLIAETSTDLIRILELDMTIRYASSSHLEMLGYEPSELIGSPCSFLVVPEERDYVKQCFYEMVTERCSHYQLNFHVRHKNGSTMMLETHGRLILDDDGEPTGAVVVSRDLTKRVMEDEENRRREKLTLAGQLAAGIAHEIRNPLTAIKGFTQLLRTSSERQPFYTSVIETEIERVEMIVNEFLLLAKPEAVELKTLDLGSVLADVVTLLGPQAMLQNVQIHLELMPEVAPVFAAESQLKQVFINLIKNALESMPHGGNVYVSSEVVGDLTVTRVKDEGPGMSEESLLRLGEPFYTTKAKGTGLGLMVSHKIIKDHGGEIRVHTSSSEGTCLEITLPVTANVTV